MSAFLLTWKEDNWDYSNIESMLEKFNLQGWVDESWRLRSHKKAQVGDRVWLLRQGPGARIIFGFGEITSPIVRSIDYGKPIAPVRFSKFVDPKTSYLLGEDVVMRFLRKSQINAQASGDPLTEVQDAAFCNALSIPMDFAKTQFVAEKFSTNPDWVRDELILALDVYLQHRQSLPPKNGIVVKELSTVLQELGKRLFHPDARAKTFRNEAGVNMKLGNFRRLDPLYTSKGKVGLSRGAKGEADVWSEFAANPAHCHAVANVIRLSVASFSYDTGEADTDDGFEEAPEGKLLTKQHISRERSRKLVAKKIAQIKAKLGKLECEVCDFNFADRYGPRGEDVIECHHKRPVSELLPGEKTHLNDLALVCANCHRIIHRKRPWLTIDELKQLLLEN